MVRRNKTNQLFGSEAAIGMSDKGPRHSKYPGIPSERTIRQFWQLAIKLIRQMVVDIGDLFLDHVKIVEQPLCCGCYGALISFGVRDGLQCTLQRLSIRFNTECQRFCFLWRRRYNSCSCQCSGVLFQTFLTEKFRANRFFIQRCGRSPELGKHQIMSPGCEQASLL